MKKLKFRAYHVRNVQELNDPDKKSALCTADGFGYLSTIMELEGLIVFFQWRGVIT